MLGLPNYGSMNPFMESGEGLTGHVNSRTLRVAVGGVAALGIAAALTLGGGTVQHAHTMTAAERIVLASVRTTAASPAGGYWVVDAAGRVHAYGSAVAYGSAPSHLNQPVVGIVLTSDGLGYWLVAKDGGVFAFGDAPYEGNALGTSSSGSVVAIASKTAPGSGSVGPQGPRGATGPAGATGATGPVGPAGPSGSSASAEFFALMPPDNAAAVAPGTDVSFPQDGPSVGSSIVRTGPSSFNLAAVGVYEVSFNVPVTEAGQLLLTLNGADLAYTVVGRATGTSDISEQALIDTTAVNSILTVRNPAGNSTALSITPLAGGTRPVSDSLLIQLVGP